LSIKKVEIGVPGLDMMLGGGLPEGRVILVTGGPGTGKTILCSEFLYYGATKQNEKAVYISLDEKKPIVFDMSTFRVFFSFGLKSEGRPLSITFIGGLTFPCVCWVMASPKKVFESPTKSIRKSYQTPSFSVISVQHVPFHQIW